MDKQNFCLYMPPLSSITTYREMVDYAAAHGVTKLETLNILDLSTPDPEVAKDLKAYADSKGISFPCVSVGLSLVDDDREEAIEAVKRYADIAKILGSPYLHHTIALNFSEPQKIAENFELFYERGIAAVREIYDYARTLGIRTIYEDQGFLFNGVRNFERFLDQVERDVGVVADFGNITQAGEDIVDFLKAFASRVCHVHIKDVRLTADNPDGRGLPTLDNRYMHEVPLGTGEVPFAEGMALLRQVGYDGYIALETSASADTAEAVDELVQCANALMGAE